MRLIHDSDYNLTSKAFYWITDLICILTSISHTPNLKNRNKIKDEQDENKLVVPPLVFELEICDKDGLMHLFSFLWFWGNSLMWTVDFVVNSFVCCLFVCSSSVFRAEDVSSQSSDHEGLWECKYTTLRNQIQFLFVFLLNLFNFFYGLFYLCCNAKSTFSATSLSF